MSKKILLAVTGGIACYKAADLASKLTQAGHDVWVLMTEHAKEFIGPATFRAITNNPVCDKIFADPAEAIPHVRLAENIALMIVAPATANIIGKAAQGVADDLVSTTYLACQAPVLFVPAMNTAMWENTIVQQNLDILRSRGNFILEPESGRMACGTTGIGRYPDNTCIMQTVTDILNGGQLKGKKIIVTYGGTKEPIDPVRVITNNSSGKMGLALITAARKAGATVVGIEAQTVTQLKEAIAKDFTDADCLIMAAAVSDYKVKAPSQHKVKSEENELTITLEKNEDLLAYFGEQKKKQKIIGFALESEELIENAKKKLKKKNCDLIIANDITALGADRSAVTILDQNGIVTTAHGTKNELAEKIIALCRNLG